MHIMALCCDSFCAPYLDCVLRKSCITLLLPLCEIFRLGPRSAATHERSWIFPLGNKGYRFVSLGNKLAARVSLMVIYSLSFAARFLLEQPQGSKAEVHPRLEELMTEHRIYKQGVWGGAWADDRSRTTPKRHILYSNDIQLLRELGLAGASLSKEDLNKMRGEPLAKKTKKADGSTAWTGDKQRLSASQWGPQLACVFGWSNCCGMIVRQTCSL